ncbi:MAG TPA: hypothetical protein VFE84_05755 [Patescibacteria group bacterium]|jgi:hypothetical protein|nr:hypothetical protein [Patescibacteria group bacterium]
MPTLRALRVAAFCLVSGLVVPVAALGAAKPYHIAGARRNAERKWEAADLIAVTQQGVAFEIGYLDPGGTRRALKSTIGRDVDLLPGRVDEHRPGYLVFVLQITNGSAQDLVFNPGQARLATDKGDVKIAMDYTALYEIAVRIGPDAPSLDQLDRAIFDRSVTVTPGGSIRKLIAFEAPREDRYKVIEVRLAELNIGPLSMDAVFPFRKFFDQ